MFGWAIYTFIRILVFFYDKSLSLLFIFALSASPFEKIVGFEANFVDSVRLLFQENI